MHAAKASIAEKSTISPFSPSSLLGGSGQKNGHHHNKTVRMIESGNQRNRIYTGVAPSFLNSHAASHNKMQKTHGSNW